MVAGIQKEYQQITPDLCGHVQQWHGLGLERRAHRNLRPEFFDGPGQDFLGRAALELLRETRDLSLRQHGRKL